MDIYKTYAVFNESAQDARSKQLNIIQKCQPTFQKDWATSDTIGPILSMNGKEEPSIML